MLNISREEIKDIATNELTFARGEKYFLEGKARIINFDKNTHTFSAVVVGKFPYSVKVQFDEDGYFCDATCNCPAYEEYWGYCKHIVAVLFDVRKKKVRKEFDYFREEENVKDILDFFNYQESTTKIPLNLEITFELVVSRYRSFNNAYLSLRIGENKLYVVKSVKKLIESIVRKESLYFGKEFSFDPNMYCFKEEDKPIIDLLISLYDNEEALSDISFNYKNPSLLKGKRANLPPSTVKKFFELLGDRCFNVVIDNITYKDIKINYKDLPVDFFLTKENNDLKLEVSLEHNVTPLDREGEYIFANEEIYKVTEYQRKNLKPFYETLNKQDGNLIKIPNKYSERFISEVYPVIKKLGEIKIDEKVKDSFYNPGLKPRIYFDNVDNNITADIKFVYGDITLNAFNDRDNVRIDDKIILRDISKEKEVLSFFEIAEFKVSKNHIYLDDEEKMFDFMYYKLPMIQEIAEVYYSDSFKNVKIQDSTSFSGRVRLNPHNSLLEFNFSVEGIDNSELKDVFESLKEKRRYYRLKSGAFLPLDIKELHEISSLFEYMDLEHKDFEKDVINIPKFRALYIDEHLKVSNINSVKRNLKFKELVQNVKEPGDIDYKIPCELDGVLRGYQRLGFKWLKTLHTYGFGGILADDMGLGKTLQVLTFLLSERNEKGNRSSIIVAPTSLVYNWLAEVEKFTPELNTLIIAGKKDEREKLISNVKDYDVVVTSYPLIRRDIDLYKDIDFRFCILDEAQHIKNPQSQNAKSVKEINAESYFALTGTPIENSLTELWSIFDFVMPGYLLNHSKFMKKFERPIVKNRDNTALKELSRHIRPFVLRRIKKDVLKELPDKIENKVTVQLTNEQKKIYLAYLQKIKGEIEEEIRDKGFEKSHIKILAGLTRLRQICCHPSMFIEGYDETSGKLLLLEELINEAMEGGHRILLFSQFTSMLRIIKEMLQRNGIEFKYLDGSTNIKERGKLVNSFNEGNGNIFLISLKAGGTGLNLTGADTVIHFDPWWNPAVEEQATDRAYRIGQKNTVHVMKLITKGTIEEKIYKLQEKKRKLIESVITPGETLVSKLSEEEIKDLFELSID
ncbi:SNF2 helicase associated domain-containing protein [Wukongibacter sp. M2B1]|uniref:DEAD/DEAH box helicase n=1 Tax=Wukongibacter sp. M2B1 TaxID=3088895 RepID=UPI003D78B99E